MILQAAEEVGFVKRVEKFDAENKSIGFELVATGEEGVKGYLKWAAVHQPARFLAMLTRALPMQINAKTERPGSGTDVRYQSFEEVVAEMKAVGYTDEQIAYLISDLRPKGMPLVAPAEAGAPKAEAPKAEAPKAEEPKAEAGGQAVPVAGGDYLDEDGNLGSASGELRK